MEWHIEAGTDGIVVAGTTGESAALDAGERDWLLESALETAAGRCTVLAGTGAPSTAAAVALTVVVAVLAIISLPVTGSATGSSAVLLALATTVALTLL